MKTRAFFRISYIFSLLCLFSFRGSVYAFEPVQKAEKNGTIKASIIISSEGLIEAAPEVCAGGSVTQHFNKQKLVPGGITSFITAEESPQSFILKSRGLPAVVSRVPRFIFYRNIRL